MNREYSNIYNYLFVIVVITGLVFVLFARLIEVGSEKVPDYLLPVNETENTDKFNALITNDQKCEAVKFFKIFPFLLKSSVEYYLKNDCSYSRLDYLSVAFLPTIQSPWILDLIYGCLENSDPWERIGAIDALRTYPLNEMTILRLIERWKKEKDPFVQLDIAKSLCGIKDKRITETLKLSLEDIHNHKRNISLVSLYVETSNVEYKDEILKVLKLGNKKEANSLISILWAMMSEKSDVFLIEAKKNKNPLIQESANKYLEKLKSPKL